VGKKAKQEPEDIIVPAVKNVILLTRKRLAKKSQFFIGSGNIF